MGRGESFLSSSFSDGLVVCIRSFVRPRGKRKEDFPPSRKATAQEEEEKEEKAVSAFTIINGAAAAAARLHFVWVSF